MKRLALVLAWQALIAPAITLPLPLLAAEPPKSAAMIYTAADLPKLAQGVPLAQGETRTLRVWAPASQIWTATREGDVISLSSEAAPGDATPRWLDLGPVAGSPGGIVKLTVAGTAPPAPEANGKAKPDETPPPAPVPTLLVLDPDPAGDPGRLLDVARGAVDSTAPSPDRRRGQVRTNREGADFHAPPNAEAWRDRAAELRDQMWVALGLRPLPPKTPLNPKVYGLLERDGYTIEKVVLETFPGFTLSGNLYRPKRDAASGKLPAILCPHGHWEDGRMRDDVQHRCIRWAKLGAVVFMYDMVGYNDSKPFGHEFLNERLRRWGLSLFTLQTWNSIRALDWIASLPDVDPARIGCTGESGGGTQTFILSALDERIKVSAPVVMVSDGFQGGCVCENAAGLRIGTDNVEFAALFAPRPMILVGASGDWTANTMTRAFPAIRGVYSLIGSPDRLEAVVHDFPHNYNQTSRNTVYAFMGRWLLGLQDSDATREGDQTAETAETLLAFDAEHPAPADARTPAQIEDDLIRLIGDGLESLAPTNAQADWDASRRYLATIHKVRIGLELPAPEAITARVIRQASREGLSIIHSQIGRRGEGDAIPVVRITPARANGRTTVIADDRGKAGLVAPNGELSELARALLDRGQAVVGFDPLFVGESIDPDRPEAHRPDVVHGPTYNPTVAADQMQDLATVVSWAGSQPEIRELSLFASGLAGRQALLARPRLGNLARSAFDLDGGDDEDARGPAPAAIDLPGVQQFGGLRGAAALSAPASLRVVRPGANFARNWPKAAYDRAGAPGELRIDDGAVSAADIARWIDAGE
ncbi:acetylxylan esterase [Planctomyces sp. SH-PL62]|uniref:acetylxylan esterase n=1 Tax=Planctomyces sp. SH-PL62 TaxID=1636152 RepID=UPI00078DA979|nr:acetylxylan esterase [Planctomyces sp. SH-PL62]AMV38898.1 Acetyl xylan esterase (AXE1) [Planctomyces sp. SH-PL62]